MFWFLNILAVIALSALISRVLLKEIMHFSFKKSLFDEPDGKRKVHNIKIPRLGGLAFTPVVLISIALIVGADMIFFPTQVEDYFSQEIMPFALCFSALLILFVMGMLDDLGNIRYPIKFAVQIACGLIMAAAGIHLNNFHGILGCYEVSTFMSWFMTVLVTVYIINSINLIDGIDGLASSLCGIALIFYGILYVIAGELFYALLAFASVGVLIPFFYYNVYGKVEKHRKTFMGDTGSLTLGMITSILTIKLVQTGADGDCVIKLADCNMFVVAYAPMMIPCFDAARVYFFRMRKLRNPFKADKNHIHHKLIDMGYNHLQVMMRINIASLIFVVANIFASQYIEVNMLICINIVLWCIVLSAISKKADRNRRAKPRGTQ